MKENIFKPFERLNVDEDLQKNMPSALDSIPNTNFKKVLRFYTKDVSNALMP